MNQPAMEEQGLSPEISEARPMSWQPSYCQQLITRLALALAVLALSLPSAAFASGTLTWNVEKNQVSADVKSESLLSLLSQIATTTGWHVYVEPDTIKPISAKFQSLIPGDALKLLLGGANFALVPEANSASKLYVFRTSRDAATQLVQPGKAAKSSKGKIIPNQLIVRLKPGASIDELARLLGAKVIGRLDDLNAYLLQFDDQAATDAARLQLLSNPEVAAVDYNYSIDRPMVGMQGLPGPVPPPDPQFEPPPNPDCQVKVGLVDTGLQSMGPNLDKFVSKRLAVVDGTPADTGQPEHATSMAETMLRSVQAANNGKSSMQIISANVYGSNPTTSSFDVARGIMQVVTNGATIVNLSLGSQDSSEFLESVIQQANSKNVLFIGAAGNTPVTTPFYPAAYPEVNAVTAIDQGQLAPYANRGSFITLGAPGNTIVTYDGQSWAVSGTSASAAYTTGIAAAFLEKNPCSSVADSQAYLRKNLGVTITPK